jgi:hypothetical protein
VSSCRSAYVAHYYLAGKAPSSLRVVSSRSCREYLDRSFSGRSPLRAASCVLLLGLGVEALVEAGVGLGLGLYGVGVDGACCAHDLQQTSSVLCVLHLSCILVSWYRRIVASWHLRCILDI